MAAGRYSFTIEQGATLSFELQYKDEDGNPINLSGYSGKMQIRTSIDAVTASLTLSSSLQPDGTGLNFSGSGGSKDPKSGSIGIYIASCTSSMLNFDGTAYYDLEIYSGSGNCPYTVRLLEGQIQLSKEITR